MEQTINKTEFLTGTEGEYLGVKYKWSKDQAGHQLLILVDNGVEQLVWKTDTLLDNPEMAAEYKAFAELYVKKHLEEKKLQSKLNEVV